MNKATKHIVWITITNNEGKHLEMSLGYGPIGSVNWSVKSCLVDISIPLIIGGKV